MSEKSGPDTGTVVGWTPLVFIGLGLSMIVMDVTIVNTSLPQIIEDLDMSSIDSEWIQSMYSLVFASLLITFGRLGDKVGRRTVFVVGAVVFGVASLVATQVSTGGELIAIRAVQGVGGAMISPTSLSLLNSLYFGKRRAVAFAVYGAILAGMAGVGPLLGGYLTQYYSWRHAFGVNVPLAVVVIVGALLFVPNTRDDKALGRDLVGMALSAVGVGALIFGLIEGRSDGWWIAVRDVHVLGLTFPQGGISPVPIAFAISAVTLVSLWFYEEARRRAKAALLIDMTLFKIRSFGFGSLVALIVSLGEFGILFALPLFVQNALGYSPLGSGALTASVAAGALVAGSTAAVIANRTSPRLVTRVGMSLEVVGIVTLGLVVSATVPTWHMVVALVIYGLGIGYAQSQLVSIILSNVPVEESGQASGTEATARRIGTALGSAVIGTILFVGLQHDTEQKVSQVEGVSTEQATEIGRVVESTSGVAISEIARRPDGEPVAQAATEAFAEALRRTSFVAAGLVAVGLATTALLPSGRPEETVRRKPSGPRRPATVS
ncbi:MFS transporter [Cellulomonas sp. P22]|uniref:MFS transporter n=1 Tax=Cellulomonas sp. P22 TaxID=3373189 RepID=UPI0037B0EAAC